MANLNCPKCGNSWKPTHRFCERCGAPFFVDLNDGNISKAERSDIFNSVYNLLADKNNPLRGRYFTPASERVLSAKLKREYEEAQRSISFTRVGFGLDPMPFSIQELWTRYGSNSLAGYSIRLTEEIQTRKTIPSLSHSDAQKLVEEFIAEGKRQAGEQATYNYSDLKDPRLNREVFCKALTWNGLYQVYALIEKAELLSWMESIIDEATGLTLRATKETYSSIWQSKEKADKSLKPDEVRDNVISDVLFGYCLRVSEVLSPYINEDVVPA